MKALVSCVPIDTAFAVLIFAVYMQGLFSNSFIISEHLVSLFLANSIVIFSFIRFCIHSHSSWTIKTFIPALLKAVIAMLLLRIQGTGVGVVPDSRPCGAAITALTLPNAVVTLLTDEGRASSSCVGDILSMVTFIAGYGFCCWYWMCKIRPQFISCSANKTQNQSQIRDREWPSLFFPSVRAVTFGFPIILLVSVMAMGLVHVYWTHPVLLLLTPLLGASLSSRNVLAQIVYMVSIGGVLLVVVTGLWLAALHRKDSGRNRKPGNMMDAAADELFQWSLAHFYLALLLVLLPSIMLVIGSRSSFLMLTFFAVFWATTSLQQTSSSSSSSFLQSLPSPTPQHHRVSMLTIVHSFMCTTCLFFAMGHKNEFSSLPASVAFVGFEEFQYHIGAILMALRTFSPHILHALCTAISITSRSTWMLSLSRSSKPSNSDSNNLNNYYQQDNRNDKTKNKKAVSSGNAVVYSLLCYSLLFTLRATATTLNVTVLRRHLMVWAIFAPKFAFDAASLLVLDCVLLVLLSVFLFLPTNAPSFGQKRDD